MKLSKQFVNLFLLPMIFLSGFIIATYSYSVINARAILISPRLGAPLCTSSTDGTWQNIKITNNIHIFIGIELVRFWFQINGRQGQLDIRISHSSWIAQIYQIKCGIYI
jgi:hypothetical protein